VLPSIKAWIKNTSLYGPLKSMLSALRQLKGLVVGNLLWMVTGKSERVNLLLEPASGFRRFKQSHLCQFTMLRDISQLDDGQIEELINRFWNVNGHTWSTAKFEQTREWYGFDLNKISPCDTYYMLCRKLQEIANASLGSVKPTTLLEIGCGNGRFLAFLNGKDGLRAYGVDLNEKVIREAKEYFRSSENISVHSGDAVEFCKKLSEQSRADRLCLHS